MEIIVQLLMGMSLAACAGLRAWMALLVVGFLGRTGMVHLDASFDILTHTSTLLVFGVATVLEILGDKVIVVDHLLDSVGTVLRPMAGSVLAASMLTGMDPEMSLILGVITGGSTALAVHAGKSAVRAGTTTLSPAHGGAGNAVVSLVEDVLAFFGIWAAILVPVVAAIVIALAVFFLYRMIARVRARGRKLRRTLRHPGQ
jgi:hypothetical protein